MPESLRDNVIGNVKRGGNRCPCVTGVVRRDVVRKELVDLCRDAISLVRSPERTIIVFSRSPVIIKKVYKTINKI